jgi:hypothetical protein
MNKTDLFLGLVLGLLVALLGCFLFITFFTDYDFGTGVAFLKAQGFLGKLIAVGSLLDLALFGVLLKMNKELMARGVVFCVLLLALLSLFYL